MLLTEQVKQQTIAFLKMSSLEIVKSINSKDRTIGKVVQQVLPEITSAVELITERLNQGGRLLHSGAGTEWTYGNLG
jgi:N-acetylmuramic acid 6-phosphate etherase